MLVKIKSIKKIDSDSKRYDIQVKDNSNFFANTILVHNSLGIVFNYKGEWICASRGSFTSEYAIKIAELLKNYPVEFLYTQQTYCFELLWTLRPIVLPHAKDDIVMLASFVTETGEEMDVQIPYYTDRFNVVRKFDGLKDYKLLKEMVTDDMEGFVLRYKSGFRMKIKGANYCRLHNIITECSTVDIWKALKEGNGMSKFLENVPDEFDAWVHFQIAKMEAIFTKEWETAVDLYNKIYNKYGGLPDKKVFSDEVKLVDRKYQGILFNMYNEIPVDQIIWKYIRPVYEKPIF